MRIHPKYIGIAIFVLIVGLALLVFVRHHGRGEAGPPPAKPSSTSTATQAPTGDPSSLTRDKASLNEQVARFTALYFSFDPQYCGQDAKWKAALRPFATDAFLAHASFGDCSSGNNALMLQDGSTSKATAEGALTGEMNKARTKAAGVVTVEETQYDSGNNPGQVITFPQPMQWEKSQGTWRIAALN